MDSAYINNLIANWEAAERAAEESRISDEDRKRHRDALERRHTDGGARRRKRRAKRQKLLKRKAGVKKAKS